MVAVSWTKRNLPCSIGAPKSGTRWNIVGMFNKRKEFNYGLQDTEIYRYGKVPH